MLTGYDELATSTARRIVAATWMMASTTVLPGRTRRCPRGGRDGPAAPLDQVALQQQVQRGIERMQAVAPRAARTHNLHRAGGRFRVTLVHARLRALDTAGVRGRTGSLSRAALVVMFLQELAYQLLAPPVQFPFAFALAHLSGFAGGEEGFGVREDCIGRRARGTRCGGRRFAALARRVYVLGILSSRPSQVSPPKAPYQERRANVQGGSAPEGTGACRVGLRPGWGDRRTLSPLKTHWSGSVLGHKSL